MTNIDASSAMVEFIQLADETITELQKQAEVAKSTPVFTQADLKKTAEVLLEAGFVSSEAAEVITESFQADPTRALVCLQKVAQEVAKNRESDNASDSGVGSLVDASDAINKTALSNTHKKRESDEVFEKAFGIK